MKKIILLFFVFSIAGCDQIKDEFHTSGGYPAQLLDNSTFVARTQNAHLHRYYYLLASAAPMALYSVNDEDGAEDAIRHTNSAIEKLNSFNTAMACTENSCSDKNSIKDTKDGFETNSLDVQRAIWLLASDVKNNIGLEIKVSDPASIVSSSLSALKKAKSLTGPFRNFAAAYREAIHITTQSTQRQCENRTNNSSEIVVAQTNLDKAKQQAQAASDAAQRALEAQELTAAQTDIQAAKKAADMSVEKLETLKTLEKTLADAQRNSKQRYKNCSKLIADASTFYEDGKKLAAIVFEDKSYERQLKILQHRTIEVIESDELGSVGFLDKQAIGALNLLVRTACQHANKFLENPKETTCGPKAISDKKMPQIDEPQTN